MDKLSQVGRILRKTQDNTNYALNRDILKQSLIHRTRDIFDNVLPFEFEFDTPNVASTSYLTLIFTPPPPTPCQPATESSTVTVGCFVGKCETYLNADTGSILDTTYPFISGTVAVHVNDVETTQYTITDSNTITLTHNTSPGDIVNIYYVYQIEGCDVCEQTTSTIIIDDFERVVADGWGTSTSGDQWQFTELDEPPDVTGDTVISVDGSAGQLETENKVGPYTARMDLFTNAGVSSGSDFAEVRWLVSGSPDGEHVFGAFNLNRFIYWALAVGGDIFWNRFQVGSQVEVVQGDPDYLTGIKFWVAARLHVNGDLYFKNWKDSVPEPPTWTQANISLTPVAFDPQQINWFEINLSNKATIHHIEIRQGICT